MPQIWEVTGSALPLPVNHTGLFILCGDKVYREFPPKWLEQCGLRYLAASVTRYSVWNASHIINLGSCVHLVITYMHIWMRSHRNFTCVSPLEVLSCSEDLILKLWKLWIRRHSLNFFHGNRTRVPHHCVNLELLQSGVNSFVLWDSKILVP